MTSSIHPFGRGACADVFRARAVHGPDPSPATGTWWGRFGGVTAATLLQAVMQHPDRLGDPCRSPSITPGGAHGGAFHRAGHARAHQPIHPALDADHPPGRCRRRARGDHHGHGRDRRAPRHLERWRCAHARRARPHGPPAIEHGPEAMEWLNRYEMRPITGALPRAWDGSGDHSLTQLWMRDAPAGRWTFARCLHWLTCSSPRLVAPRTACPQGTVSITVYFHASAEQLAQPAPATCWARRAGRSSATGFLTRPCGCGTKPAPCWPPATRSFTTK